MWSRYFGVPTRIAADPTIKLPPCPFSLVPLADGSTRYELRNITIAELATTLGNYPTIDELVVDRTGLTGRFDMSIHSYEHDPKLPPAGADSSGCAHNGRRDSSATGPPPAARSSSG
jgi:uncharacterized protein (TIGR03435 family)